MTIVTLGRVLPDWFLIGGGVLLAAWFLYLALSDGQSNESNEDTERGVHDDEIGPDTGSGENRG